VLLLSTGALGSLCHGCRKAAAMLQAGQHSAMHVCTCRQLLFVVMLHLRVWKGWCAGSERRGRGHKRGCDMVSGGPGGSGAGGSRRGGWSARLGGPGLLLQGSAYQPTHSRRCNAYRAYVVQAARAATCVSPEIF